MLEVKNLTVTYTKTDIYGRKKIVIALDNISFNFTGNILGILGETGSGKTTLAKALAGLIPYSGSIIIDGAELSELKRRKLLPSKLQLIFQDPNTAFNPRLDVLTQIMDISKNLEEINKLKNRLGLKTELKKKPSEFSGGEKQRIAILRALLKNPEILIFDEPTSALDAYLKNEFINIIMEVAKEKRCLVISHDVNIVEKIAEYIMVIKDGKIIEYDSKSNILKKPKNEYTKKLLAFIDVI